MIFNPNNFQFRHHRVASSLAQLPMPSLIKRPLPLGKRNHYAVEFESPVLASRDDVTVSFAELNAFLATMPEDRRAPFLADPERFTQAIGNLLNAKHRALDAISAGMDQDPEIQARLANAIWRELAKVFRERYPDDHERSVYTTRAEELYLRDPDQFKRAQSVSFSHVLLSAKEYPDEQARQTLAGRLLEELEGGAEFSEIAREHSNDPSVSTNDGAIESIAPNRLDPQFREQVQEMDVGETGIVESSFGTHIVRVDDRNDAGVAPFEDVADELAERARRQHRNRIMEQYQQDFLEHSLSIPDGATRRFLEQYGVSWD